MAVAWSTPPARIRPPWRPRARSERMALHPSLDRNTDGSSNTADGLDALRFNTRGYHGTAVGATALYSNTIGNENTAVGFAALHSITTGSRNIAVGLNAGYALTTGSNNIDLGTQGAAGDSGIIRIGTAGTHTAAYIAGVTAAHITGSPVYVTSNGQLGVLASSERYKTRVLAVAGEANRLHRLRPVRYHLKNDPTGAVQYGLIAEEVADVYPELVIRDEQGTIQGVRYDELAPLLVKEVQQEQRTIQAQTAQLGDVLRQLADLQDANRQLSARVAKIVEAQAGAKQ